MTIQTSQTHDEAQNWLEDLRTKRPSWSALRRMAEVGALTDLEPGSSSAASVEGANASEPAPVKAARQRSAQRATPTKRKPRAA